jgi:RND family efflux transporter MFP subunit
MNKRILSVLILIIVLYGGWKFLYIEKKEPEKESSALTVTVISPEQKTITKYLNVTGITVAKEEVQIFSELTNARVEEIYADAGDVIKKGQKLAMLDTETLIIYQAQLQAEYNQAADDFKRIDAIKDTGAVSQQMLMEKRTAMQVAKARMDDVILSIKRSTIMAPVTGVITERKVKTGALANSNEPLYLIAENGKIEVEVNIPETEMGKIKKERQAHLQIAGKKDTVQGKVRLITPRIDQSTRTAIVRIELKNQESLAIGLFVSASIATNEIRGFSLPATAIQYDDKGSFVFEVNSNGRTLRRDVILIDRDEQAVIIENIPISNPIIALAGSFIKDGDIVNVVEAYK